MGEDIDRLLKWEVDPAFRRRAKLIAETVGKETKRGRIKILEVGCGRGFYENLLTTLYPIIEITGIDTNKNYVELAKEQNKNKGAKFLTADGMSIPFPDRIFDVVIATEVLEHVENDLGLLQEIKRVIKRNGLFILSVPVKNYPIMWDPLNWLLEKLTGRHVSKDIWWLAGIWADHVRLYNEDELTHKLSIAGWKIEKVDRCTKYCAPAAHFLLYGIGKNIVEQGLLKELNRFNFSQNKSGVLKWVVKYFAWWDRKNKTEAVGKNDSFVNLVVTARNMIKK